MSDKLYGIRPQNRDNVLTGIEIGIVGNLVSVSDMTPSEAGKALSDDSSSAAEKSKAGERLQEEQE